MRKKSKQQTISLYMIVKDEERDLPQCLESVKDVVDEIVILDTGSTDSTIEIAMRYGAKIFHHKWNDSFGDMRNYALKYPKGEWILQLDADDRLVQEDAKYIKEAIKHKDVSSVFFKIINVKGEPIGQSQYYCQKLFRNGLGAYYEGGLHPILQIKGKSFFPPNDIRIIHHGYNLNKEESIAKSKRYTDMLLKEIKDKPDDPRLYLHISKCYFVQGLYDLTIHAGKKVLEYMNKDTIKIDPEIEIFMIMSFAFFHKQQIAAAEQMCKCAMDIRPDYLDPVYFMGKLCYEAKRYEQAIVWFKRYMELRDELLKAPRFDLKETYYINAVCDAHLTLGSCYINIGKCIDAEKEFLNAIAQNPESAEAYNGLAVALEKQEKNNEALVNCTKAIDLNNKYKDAQENLRLIHNKLKVQEMIET